MAHSYEHKVVVVTGGASGIGQALCQAFAAEGARVIAADIDESGAESTVTGLPGTGHVAVGLDVGDARAWVALRETVSSEYGRCDVLCNNAGIMRVGPFLEANLADWEDQARVNALGVILGCRTFAPLMVNQGEGHIVNTASLAGLAPWPEGALYTASKYAVVGFSEALQAELDSTGVGVSVLCPGGVDTPMNYGFEPVEDERRIPPDEVATFVLAAIEAGRTWVFTHAEYLPFLEQRHQAILSDHDSLR